MRYIKDRYGELQQCKRLIESPEWQPATGEVLYTIYAQGYDDVRMIALYVFFTRKEMEDKYHELFQEYMEQAEKEHFDKKM